MIAVRTSILLTVWVLILYLNYGTWFLMVPPKELWGEKKSEMFLDGNISKPNPDYPWPAPAVEVTMRMCSLFFFVYFVLAVIKELGRAKYSQSLVVFQLAQIRTYFSNVVMKKIHHGNYID